MHLSRGVTPSAGNLLCMGLILCIFLEAHNCRFIHRDRTRAPPDQFPHRDFGTVLPSGFRLQSEPLYVRLEGVTEACPRVLSTRILLSANSGEKPEFRANRGLQPCAGLDGSLRVCDIDSKPFNLPGPSCFPAIRHGLAAPAPVFGALSTAQIPARSASQSPAPDASLHPPSFLAIERECGVDSVTM